MTELIAAIALVMASALPLVAQPAALDAAQPAGTEFYIGFMQNDDEGASTKFMGLLITSQVSTTGSVEIPGFETVSFSARPGQITSVDIPRAFEHTVSEDTISVGTTTIPKAVRVTSRAPISVFVMNARSQTAGGYSAIPVDQWGTHYLAFALPNTLGRRTSEIMIVAAHDDTYIRFTPSATTYRQSRGVPTQFKLERGRTYFVQALLNSIGLDLSGSEILATRPVGVICGHVRTTVTLDGQIPSSPQAYAMHQATMILPDSAWGREFVSMPMRPSGDRFRVMPAGRATIVATLYGSSVRRDTLQLEAGEVRDLFTIGGQTITGPVHWSSSAPALVTQMRTGTVYGDPANSPAMIVLSSTAAFTPRTAFVALDQISGGLFPSHELSIVARVPAIENAQALLAQITIDGVKLAPGETYQRVGSTDFFTLRATVSPGGHVLVAPEGVAIGGTVSGSNGTVHRDAYAWALPTWGQPTQFDAAAPYVSSVQSISRGLVTVVASDRSGGYFSGVVDIAVHPDAAPGWRRVSINSPLPDEDATATFQAIADPSGPLLVTLRDRDGNLKDTTAHPSVCFKTATAETKVIALRARVGSPSAPAPVRLLANSCGDEAHVTSVTLSGPDKDRFLVNTATLPLTISGGSGAEIASVIGTPTEMRPLHCTLLAVVDDSTVAIDLELAVDPSTGVESDAASRTLLLVVSPNPTTDRIRIELPEPAARDAELLIADKLGRVVHRVYGDRIAGQSVLEWDGRSSDGLLVPSGTYVVSLEGRGLRSVAVATIVR